MGRNLRHTGPMIFGVMMITLTLACEDGIAQRPHKVEAYPNVELFLIREQRKDVGLRYGLMDSGGREILACSYEALGEPHHGVCPASQEGKWGLLDISGNWVLLPTYDELSGGSEGLFVVKRGRLYGYVNSAGRVVISVKYTAARPFSEGLAAVAFGPEDSVGPGRPEWGFVDAGGERVIGFREGWTNVSDFERGLALATRDSYPFESLFQAVKPNGEICTIERTLEGRSITVWQGLIMSARMVGPVVVYDGNCEQSSQHNGLWLGGGDSSYLVQERGNCVFYDREGRVRLSVPADAATVMRSGRAFIKRDGLCALIDHSGTELTPFIFAEVEPFLETRAFVRMEGEAGYHLVDLYGTRLSMEQFDAVLAPFRGGLARVQANGKWVYVATSGQVVWRER